MGGVKTKFESGDVGKKEFPSEARNEAAQVGLVQGKAQSTKDRFEKREERQYNSTKMKELEELKMARTLAAHRKQVGEEEEEETVRDSVAEEENDRYRELEQFKRTASAKQNVSKFEGGAFSNVEQSEIEARKEVQTISGSGRAADTLKKYESGDYQNGKTYSSDVKEELGTIKVDTSSKKRIYESGECEREYTSDAKDELERIVMASAASSEGTRSKFETGELLNQCAPANEERVGELEQIRSVSAAGDKKSKFESGELIRTEFDSGLKKEIETMKTGASDVKSKYESGELVRTEFDSEVKEELKTMSTGAMDKKDKYESGNHEKREYESMVIYKPIHF